jgi:hypothetical protein
MIAKWMKRTLLPVGTVGLIIALPHSGLAQGREQALCEDCYEWVDSLGYAWHHFSETPWHAGWYVGLMDGRSGDGLHYYFQPGFCEDVHDYGSCGNAKQLAVASIKRAVVLAEQLGNPNFLVRALEAVPGVTVDVANSRVLVRDCTGSVVSGVGLAQWLSASYMKPEHALGPWRVAPVRNDAVKLRPVTM